MDILAAL